MRAAQKARLADFARDDSLSLARAVSEGCTLDPGNLFPGAECWLEIGFGAGEHILALAREHPTTGLIGCEAYPAGFSRLLGRLEAGHRRNLRLYLGDARALIDLLAPASIHRVYLLYPDPWPKARHAKRRFIDDATLDRLARIMCAGAELRIATDIDRFAAHCLACVFHHPSLLWTARRACDFRRPWEGWSGTRYEAKAIAAGRRPIYLTFRRRGA